MFKKIMSCLLAGVIFVSSGILSVSAEEEISLNETDISNSFFNESEAADIALLFVMNNISLDNNWNMSTKIVDVYPLYDINNNINAYTFCLNTNNNSTGYITVSTLKNQMPIQEFSFTDRPVFEENLNQQELYKLKSENKGICKSTDINKKKIIFAGPLQYYYGANNTYYNNKNNIISKSIINNNVAKNTSSDSMQIAQMNIKLKTIIKDSYNFSQCGKNNDGQIDGYVISDRFAYMKDKYGSYTYEKGKYLSGYDGLDMDNYGGSMDCSLVSITTIANWYSTQGYNNIPDTAEKIYNDVLAIGIKHGYTEEDGTDPTKIDNIIEDSFKKWGYDVDSSNTYVWSFSTFSKEIDNDRPVIFNIATGYYSNHTISVFGYKKYDVADFLMVKDNWSTSTRYIHWSKMWNEIGSVTKTEIN